MSPLFLKNVPKSLGQITQKANICMFGHTRSRILVWTHIACVHAKSLQLCPTLCDPMDCSPSGFSVHGDSPGKNTGVGCHALLQGIFPTKGLNLRLLGLLLWQEVLYR